MKMKNYEGRKIVYEYTHQLRPVDREVDFGAAEEPQSS